MGSTPLNSLRARPSQKLRKLKMVLIMVGVLRGSTRRTFTPLTLKIGSGMEIPASVEFPTITLVKAKVRTPWEDTMSLVSNRTAEFDHWDWPACGAGNHWPSTDSSDRPTGR